MIACLPCWLRLNPTLPCSTSVGEGLVALHPDSNLGQRCTESLRLLKHPWGVHCVKQPRNTSRSDFVVAPGKLKSP